MFLSSSKIDACTVATPYMHTLYMHICSICTQFCGPGIIHKPSIFAQFHIQSQLPICTHPIHAHLLYMHTVLWSWYNPQAFYICTIAHMHTNVPSEPCAYM